MTQPASRLVSLLASDPPWVSSNYRGLGNPLVSWNEHTPREHGLPRTWTCRTVECWITQNGAGCLWTTLASSNDSRSPSAPFRVA